MNVFDRMKVLISSISGSFVVLNDNNIWSCDMTWDVGTIVKDVNYHDSRPFSSQDKTNINSCLVSFRISDQARGPAEFKHIIKRRKRN
jgi:hypothetical protein